MSYSSSSISLDLSDSISNDSTSIGSSTSAGSRSSAGTSSGSSASSVHNIDLQGQTINNYNVIVKLGRGSYSFVWLVYSVRDSKYYAMKVQNPEDYDDGIDEIDILKKISNKEPYINGMIEHFIETRINENNTTDKFICSIYNLCAGNLDGIARKGKYNTGYSIPVVKQMLKQICKGLNIIHTKLNGFHGDIKPDNILLCGINMRDKKYIQLYEKANFMEKYKEAKEKHMMIDKKNKLSSKEKLEIRKKLHKNIIDSMPEIEESMYIVDDTYIQNPNIKITDFGFYCNNNEKFNESFGTRYYQAHEIILMGDCSSPVDTWALGCMLFELITGKILFDPNENDRGTIDFNHLEMMINLCGEFNSKCLIKSKRRDMYFNKECTLNNIIYSLKKDESTKSKIEQKLKKHDITDPLLCDLLDSMLKLSPNKRIDMKGILNHKWLNLSEKTEKSTK